MKSKCNNCGWVGVPLFELHEITNLLERIDPGDVVPSGECPKCGALCYVEKPKKKHTAVAVAVRGDKTWTVRIPVGRNVSASKWIKIADCHENPMTGDGMATATKIAGLLNNE